MICPISWLVWHTEADEVVNLSTDSSILTDYITLSSLSFTPDSNFQPVLSKYHWRVAQSADSDGKVKKLKVHGSNNVRSSGQRLRHFITSGSRYVRNKTLRVDPSYFNHVNVDYFPITAWQHVFYSSYTAAIYQQLHKQQFITL